MKTEAEMDRMWSGAPEAERPGAVGGSTAPDPDFRCTFQPGCLAGSEEVTLAQRLQPERAGPSLHLHLSDSSAAVPSALSLPPLPASLPLRVSSNPTAAHPLKARKPSLGSPHPCAHSSTIHAPEGGAAQGSVADGG